MLIFWQEHKVIFLGTIGLAGSATAMLAPYMDGLTLAGKIIAGTGGFVIMALTIYIKFKEAKKLYKEK